MTKALLTCLLTAVVTIAVAEQTVTVYQLDGSIHCHEGQTSTPAEATKEKEIGVRAQICLISGNCSLTPI